MARKTPAVKSDTLIWRDRDQEISIQVETPDWYAWLCTARSFFFTGTDGTFTACSERFQRGGWYWKAYHTQSGKVHRAYLGKAEALTLKRLNQVASILAERSRSDDSTQRDVTSNVRCEVSSNPSLIKLATPNSPLPETSPNSEQRDLLLSTKLSPPLVSPDLVARPRLIARLDEGLAHKLMLVSSPAGFGKTTLLSRWSAHTSGPVAWVSLNTGDNDTTRFWTYVIASLQTLRSNLGDEALSLLRSSQSTPIETILTMLINALAAVPDDLALVLDDYHVIESSAVHSALSFLLDQMPPHLHLVIASRTDPPLPLARLRGKGQLSELRVRDLSFTSEETTIFLNEVMRLGLSSEDVAALEKHTEGWIVGLQLAALSLRDCQDAHEFIQTFAGDNQHVLDYLVDEVLRQQPEEVQNFLLQTSILDRLNGPLCEAVTNQSNGQAMLERLERANLFTLPLGNERHWYRYHPLFADVLRSRLQLVQPKQVPELHRRACTWYADHGLASEGVDHALALGDSNLAADLIQQTGLLMVKRGENTKTIDWMRALPSDLVNSRPRLGILHAWGLANVGRLDAAEARLQDVECSLGVKVGTFPSTAMATGSDRDSALQRALADVVAVRAAIAGYRGDVPLTLALSRQALAMSPEDDAIARSAVVRTLGLAYWLSGDVAGASKTLVESGKISEEADFEINAIVTLSQLAGMQVVEGRLHQASKTYQHTLRRAQQRGAQSHPVAGTIYLGMGWLLHEWNDLEAAERYVTQGIEVAKEGQIMAVMLPGYGALARVKQAQGDSEGAFDILQQADQLSRTNNFTHNAARFAAYRVRLWLAQGNLEPAVRWAASSGLRMSGEISYQREAEYMTLARVRMAQGSSAEAAKLLDRLLQKAEVALRQGSVIKILALQALALEATGDIDRALAALDRALMLAEPQGYIRTFVDLGEPMAVLLSKLLNLRRRDPLLVERRASLGYMRSLLTALDSGSVPLRRCLCEQKADQSDFESLSEREIEVLKLIAAGFSSMEVARQLVVAVSTVRTHIKNIFGKLNVHNRAQAVSRARELSLLP